MTIFWGIIALVVVLLLTLIALGLRTVPANKISLGVSNVFEDGLLFGLFAILFAPFNFAWMGIQSLWLKLHPPPPLPVEADDPIWGRNINRRVVERAFLAVQQARLKRNPNLGRKFLSAELYKRLRRECDHSTAQNEGERQSIKIKDIRIYDESIDRNDGFCHFKATVTGTTSKGIRDDGRAEPLATDPSEAQAFQETLEFWRAPSSVADAPWQVMAMSGITLPK